MDEATLKVVVDSIFSVVESVEGPVAKTWTEAMRRSVDANLSVILAIIQQKTGGA